jgi:predicted glycosyltransferase
VGRISYLDELEREYKLAFGFKPNQFPEMLSQIEKLLALKKLKKIWQEKRQKMLNDKIDVTAFMVWMVEKVPDSIYRIKQESTKTKFFDQFRGG